MKTVNLIFIAIVTFLANTAQAQSVEETEQWLNEYGKEITLSYTTTEDDFERKGSLNFKGFDGEYLNFLRSSNDSRGGSYRQIYKVLPKDILYQDLSAFSEKDFEENSYIKTKNYLLKAKSGTVLHSGKATNGFNEDRSEINYHFHNGKSEIEENTDAVRFHFSKDQSTEALRLLKAIYHFAKLKGASDLPKVKKDTF